LWSVGVLVLITILVAAGRLGAIDRAALDASQAFPSPALDLLSTTAGLFGQFEIATGIALGIVVARLRHRRRDAIVPLAIFVTLLVESVLKLLVHQGPPPPEAARTIGMVELLSSPFANSFPSGNVARASFLLCASNGAPLALVVAGIVVMVATRVYLGEHWFSDAIAGAALGVAVADMARVVGPRIGSALLRSRR
jgi:membrane-associated phospholipid phosphatase